MKGMGLGDSKERQKSLVSAKLSLGCVNNEDHACIPLPIQSFLWRQTNPFLGATVGTLHEASCVTFERVVVQNILHGLSPSLSDAISFIPRWRFIRAAFPHVVQCCAALLRERQKEMQAEVEGGGGGDGKLRSSLVKLLYILHWMVLDSASECQDENDSDDALNQCVFPVNCIQIFVYLLGPLVNVLSQDNISDNIRLESGMALWESLWASTCPSILCFAAPVKPRKAQLLFVPLIKKTIDASAAHGLYVGADDGGAGIYLGGPSDDDPPAKRRPSALVPAVGVMPSAEKPPAPVVTSSGPHKWKPVCAVSPITASPTTPSAATEIASSVFDGTLTPGSISAPQKVQTQIPALRKPEEKKTRKKKKAKSVVRSVSEYRKQLPEHKPLAKASTLAGSKVDAKGSIKFMELEKHLKFVEESGSEVVDISDRAPLVQLQDICGVSFDMEVVSNHCEVHCEMCGTIVYREGSLVGTCRCERKGSTQLKVVTLPPMEEEDSIIEADDDTKISVGTADYAEPPTLPSPNGDEYTFNSTLATSPMTSSSSSSMLTSSTSSDVDSKSSTPMRGVSEMEPDPSTTMPSITLGPTTGFTMEPTSVAYSNTTAPPTTTVTIPTNANDVFLSQDQRLTVDSSTLSSEVKITPPSMPPPMCFPLSFGLGRHDSVNSTGSTVPLSQVFGGEPHQATYFDVAVLRCLFIDHWPEEGVYWGVHYVYKRLLGILSVHSDGPRFMRQRSNSVPLPSIKVVSPKSGTKTDLEIQESENRRPPTWKDIQPPSWWEEPQKVRDREREREAAKGTKVLFEDDTPPVQVKRSTVGQKLSAVSETSSGMDMDKRESHKEKRKQSVATLKTILSGGRTPVDDSSGKVPSKNLSPIHSSRGDKWDDGSSLADLSTYFNFEIFGRSNTDSDINYTEEFASEAVGSSAFIDKQGRLDLKVILECVLIVLDKGLSLRVCEVALNLIEILLQTNILDEKERQSRRRKRKEAQGNAEETSDKESSPEFKPKTPPKTKEEEKNINPLVPFVEASIRAFIYLGCPHGCNDSVRNPQADFLRSQTRSFLNKLQRWNKKHFVACLRNFVSQTEDTHRILDFLHAFSGFCYETGVPHHGYVSSRGRMGSHLGERRAVDSLVSAGTYRNNFMAHQRGIEGLVVDAVFRPLVSKLTSKLTQLQQPENMGLFHDVRSLISYVQDHHGNPFRRVELSLLLDAKKVDENEKERDKKPKSVLPEISKSDEIIENHRPKRQGSDTGSLPIHQSLHSQPSFTSLRSFKSQKRTSRKRHLSDDGSKASGSGGNVGIHAGRSERPQTLTLPSITLTSENAKQV